MRYILADIEKARGHVVCNLQARRHNSSRVLLNENDLKRMTGTLEEKAAIIDGQILSESEAMQIINSKEWNNE